MIRRIFLAVVSGVLLTACGNTTGDRAASGAGIGAAGGAVVGAVTGLSLVQGVVLGAAAGGLTGALTDESQINLGDPIWKDSGSKKSSGLVRDIQSGLAELGYDPGPVDGVMGPKTRSAIRTYQDQNALLVDGRPSSQLAQHIQDQTN